MASKRKQEEESEDEDVIEESEPIVYRRSSSPEEDFSNADGADESGSWPVEIVSERVDYWGNVRYEAQWGNWSRPDGSNTTWKGKYVAGDKNLNGPIARWKRQQTLRREALAKEESTMDISVFLGDDIHNNNTRLRQMAFQEKLKRHKAPVVAGGRTLRGTEERSKHMKRQRSVALLSQSQATSSRSSSRVSAYSGPALPSSSQLSSSSSNLRASLSRSTYERQSSPLKKDSSVSSFVPTQEIPYDPPRHFGTQQSSWKPSQEIPFNKLSFYSPPGSPGLPATPLPMSEKARGKQPSRSQSIRSTPSRSQVYVEVLPYASVKKKKLKQQRRRSLSDEWTTLSGVLQYPITFVNVVDDEDVPPNLDGFTYLENYYELSGVDPPDEDFITQCDCTGGCRFNGSCLCQDLTEFQNGMYPYDPHGLFLPECLPRATELVECNDRCKCDLTCPNRVSQRPRDFPVEIFKTSNNRGWGVRCPVTIPKGKVVGLYTGLLVPRKTVVDPYSFDLDGYDVALADAQKHTVDSQRHGNWTRFINHSCTPNLGVYLVVSDSIPSTGVYYIAFYALRQIEAREEFVFDYHPQRANSPSLPLGKFDNGKDDPDWTDSDDDSDPNERCRCGSEKCRGYI